MKANLIVIASMLVIASTAAADDREWERDRARPFSDQDLKGTWTISGSIEATLLAPFPAEMTIATPPSAPIAYADKVTVRGTLVGLFSFDGHGSITKFQDLFKAGGLEPKAPFPLPFLPPAPETGSGSYSVASDGTVHLSTVIVDPMTSGKAGEAEYDCVLNRLPRQLDCMFSRFKTFAVDPNGFDAPVAGLVTLRPQRR
jgi:hypothetical protein